MMCYVFNSYYVHLTYNYLFDLRVTYLTETSLLLLTLIYSTGNIASG
jgi:hypothetical protein